MVTRGWGWGWEMGDEDGVSFWGDENVLELKSDDVASHCEYTKCH